MGCGPREEQMSSHKREPTWALASSDSQPSAAGKLRLAAPTQPHQTLQMPEAQVLGMRTLETISDHIAWASYTDPRHW